MGKPEQHAQNSQLLPSYGNSDKDADSNSNPHAHSDTDTDSHSDTDTDSHSNTDTDTNKNGDPNSTTTADFNENADSYPHTDGNSNGLYPPCFWVNELRASLPVECQGRGCFS